MPRYVNPIAAQTQAPQAQVSQPQAPRMQQQGYPAPAPAMGTSPYPTVSVGRVPHTAPFTPNYASVAPQPPVNFHHHAVHAPPPRAPKAQPKKPRSPPATASTPATSSVPSSFLERAVVPSSGLGAVVGASASAVPTTRLQLTKKGKKDVVDQHAVSFAADAAVAYAQYPLESVAAARYEACITAHRLEREAVAARKAAANSTTEAEMEIVAEDDGEAEKPLVFVGQLPYSTPLEIIAFVIDVLASEDPAVFAADPSSALAAAPTSVVSIHRSGRNGARVTVTSHAVVDRLMARARTAYPDVHGLWVAQDQGPMMAHDARVEAKELKVDANVVARHPLNFERPRTSIPSADIATGTSAPVATSTPVELTMPVTAEPIAPAAPTPRAVPAASASLASVAPAGLGQKQASIETVGSLASAPEPQPASLLPTAVATPPSLPVFHAPLPMLAVTQPSGSYVLVPQGPHGAAPLWLSASGSASVSMSGPGSPLSMSNATGGVASTTASPYGASSPFIVPTAAVAADHHLSGANNAQPQPQPQPQLSQPMAAMTHGFAPAPHPAFLQQPHQFANVGVSVGAPAAVPTMAWQQGAPLPPPPPHSAVTAMTSESEVSSVRGPRGGADVSVAASRSSSTTASSDAAWDAFLERNGGAVRSDLFAHSRSTTTATSVDNGAALEFRTLTHDDITTTAADAASAENMDGEIKATKTAALLDPAAWSLSWQPRTSPSTNAATPSTTPASMSRVETSTW